MSPEHHQATAGPANPEPLTADANPKEAPAAAKQQDTVLVAHKTPGLPVTVPRAVVEPQLEVPAPKDANADVVITVVEAGKEYAVEGKGAKATVNFNDVTEEALIAILIDRLEGFGATSATYNKFDENAVGDLKKALHWLHQRTHDRVSRGVEGTDKP